MKSFMSFFNKYYMLYESVLYTDRTLFKHIFCEDTEDTNFDNNEKLNQEINDDYDEKKENTDENDLESIELVKQYQANPTSEEGLDARNKLVEKYLNLVHSLAWKAVHGGYVPQKTEHNDLVQNGVISMMKGIDAYDPTKKVPFFAYIKNWINAGIKNPYDYFRVKTTPGMQSVHSDNVMTKDSLISVDKKVSGATGDFADKDTTVGDTIMDPNTSNFTDKEDDEIERAKFMEYLKRLPEKELTAVKLYFIDGKNYEEIGNVLHMSKQAARYFTDRAFEHLREFAKEEGFEPEKDVKLNTLKGAGENFNVY